MTRRAHPKPRWLRYQGRHGWVNERADDKLKRRRQHCENVKAQQADGLESQHRRNRLPVRKRTPQHHAPDVTDFGPPRRRPGRMAERPRRESRPVLNGSQSPQRYFGPRNQKRADYFKPNVVKARR